MTYYKLVSKDPEDGGPPSVFVPVEDVMTRAEWEATRDWSERQAFHAADAFNDEMLWITGEPSSVDMRAIYAALNAAVKGETDG